MTLKERQLTLDTQRYRNKEIAGTHEYCKHCIGQHTSRSCIFSAPNRSVLNRCAKAYNRMRGQNINTDYLTADHRPNTYGLKPSELEDK